MCDKMLIIKNEQYDDLRLRSITLSDLENLRQWKNTHRKSFFYQEIITEDQQKQWFEGFKTRDHDYMLVADNYTKGEYIPVGCMGFRIENDKVDVYNIMRGASSASDASFTMKDAFTLMNAYILSLGYDKITCMVLKTNPALQWYYKCGFEILEEKDNYMLLKQNINYLVDKNIKVSIGEIE